MLKIDDLAIQKVIAKEVICCAAPGSAEGSRIMKLLIEKYSSYEMPPKVKEEARRAARLGILRHLCSAEACMRKNGQQLMETRYPNLTVYCNQMFNGELA